MDEEGTIKTALVEERTRRQFLQDLGKLGAVAGTVALLPTIASAATTRFMNQVYLNSDEKLYFRDTGLYIYSSANGVLDLVSDTTANVFNSLTTLNLGTTVTTLNLGTTVTTLNVGTTSGAVNIGSTGTTRIGGASNYSEFESDGTLEFIGDATVWEDLRVPISAIKRLGFSDPGWVQFKTDGAGSVGVYALAFDPSTDEEVYFSCQLPHSYKEGSDITPHVHWAPSDANAGGVTWGLEYTWANIDGTYGNTTIITADDSTDTTSHKHHMANFSAITGTGKTLSSMLVCRLFRDVSDANDTYASDAFLLEVDFHFEKDTVGSRTISAK